MLSATNIYTGDTVISAGTPVGDGVSANGGVIAGNIINWRHWRSPIRVRRRMPESFPGTGSLIPQRRWEDHLDCWQLLHRSDDGEQRTVGGFDFVCRQRKLLGDQRSRAGDHLSFRRPGLGFQLDDGGGTARFYNVSNTTTPLIMASNINLGGSSTIKVTGANNLVVGSSCPLLAAREVSVAALRTCTCRCHRD